MFYAILQHSIYYSSKLFTFLFFDSSVRLILSIHCFCLCSVHHQFCWRVVTCPIFVFLNKLLFSKEKTDEVGMFHIMFHFLICSFVYLCSFFIFFLYFRFLAYDLYYKRIQHISCVYIFGVYAQIAGHFILLCCVVFFYSFFFYSSSIIWAHLPFKAIWSINHSQAMELNGCAV